MQTRPPGKGLIDGRKRKIACSFDFETFDQIREMASAKGVSFSAMVEELVAKAMVDEKGESIAVRLAGLEEE